MVIVIRTLLALVQQKNSNRHSNSSGLIIMMVNVVVSNSHSNRSRDRTSSRKSYAARLRYFLFTSRSSPQLAMQRRS